jgi:hypothetical protein
MAKVLNYAETFGPAPHNNDVERLASYIKNDSIIRWHLGCSQAAIDDARANLAKRRNLGQRTGYLPKTAQTGELAEEKQRLKRAKAGNKAYLRAIAKANGEAQKKRDGDPREPPSHTSG